MLGSGIINVAIGLAFIFGATAALSSVFTEMIARFLGLRGAYLLRGLRELLDGDTMDDGPDHGGRRLQRLAENNEGNSAGESSTDGTETAVRGNHSPRIPLLGMP